MTFPNLPKSKYHVRFTAPFKDGSLFAQLALAGFEKYEIAPATIMTNATGWISQRLYEMCKNSGADMEVLDTRLDIPAPTGPTSEPKADEDEDNDLYLEEITFDDLTITRHARELAEENGIHPVELLDSLGEWELGSGEWKDHKFSKADVQSILEG